MITLDLNEHEVVLISATLLIIQLGGMSISKWLKFLIAILDLHIIVNVMENMNS